MGGFERIRDAKEQKEYERERNRLDRAPCYSSDIADAWLIVEKFRMIGDYKIEISAYPKDVWCIKAYHRDGYAKSCTTSAETLPLAICIAALKAVGAITSPQAHRP